MYAASSEHKFETEKPRYYYGYDDFRRKDIYKEDKVKENDTSEI